MTRKDIDKGLLPTLLDNGSKVINLDTQPVSPLKPSERNCKKLKEIVNGDQKDESSLSKSKYKHSPRVNSKDVTQNSMYKGLLPTLLNNGSKVIKWDTQPVSPLKPSKRNWHCVTQHQELKIRNSPLDTLVIMFLLCFVNLDTQPVSPLKPSERNWHCVTQLQELNIRKSPLNTIQMFPRASYLVTVLVVVSCLSCDLGIMGNCLVKSKKISNKQSLNVLHMAYPSST